MVSLFDVFTPFSNNLDTAVLVLIEYTFLSPAYLYAFGIYKITFQPDSPAAISSKTNSTTGEAPTRSNICKFFFDVINVFDSFGYLDYPEDSLEYSKVVSVDPSQKVTSPSPNPPATSSDHLTATAIEEADGDSQQSIEQHRPGQLVSISQGP